MDKRGYGDRFDACKNVHESSDISPATSEDFVYALQMLGQIWLLPMVAEATGKRRYFQNQASPCLKSASYSLCALRKRFIYWSKSSYRPAARSASASSI